ncbi:MAG: 2,3-bisphosphoglycerate-independent phosphoglycerate mutase [candidate division WOR-3 bacterium]|nr:MAG: 2,3-bisphosphoglycerate-independent phosphoglycerate mutase [candidate division WOR-3 bacterium]
MQLIESLVSGSGGKILLVVLDGLGGVPRDNRTELEAAWTPNLNRLAAQSSLGLAVPIDVGVSPGSGPAHLALFGYDPLAHQVGRGVLEALGIGLEIQPTDLCARANFAAVDENGVVVDRRAGRIPTELCAELCRKLQEEISELEDVEVIIRPGKEHRFVVVFRGPGIEEGLTGTDPLREGLSPKKVKALLPAAAKAARVVDRFVGRCQSLLSDRQQANAVLLRGLAQPPELPKFGERFGLKPAAVAAYPMYRGIARLVGMTVLETGGSWAEEVDTLREHVSEYDFFYLHFKEFDKAGEDGDFDAKVELIEQFDEEVLPFLLEMQFDVLCITGDHSTPAVLKSHSWHSVPLLLHSRYVRPQVQIAEFGERACARGNLGYVRAKQIMNTLLAHALRLGKFGA